MAYHNRDVTFEVVFNHYSDRARHSLVFQGICFHELLDLGYHSIKYNLRCVDEYNISSILYHVRWDDALNKDINLRTFWNGLREIFPVLCKCGNGFRKPVNIPVNNVNPNYILFILRTVRMIEEQAEAIDTFTYLINQGYNPHFCLLMCQQFKIGEETVQYKPCWSWDAHWLFSYPCVTRSVYTHFTKILDRIYVDDKEDYNTVKSMYEDVQFALGDAGRLDHSGSFEYKIFPVPDKEIITLDEFNQRIKNNYQQLVQEKSNAA